MSAQRPGERIPFESIEWFHYRLGAGKRKVRIAGSPAGDGSRPTAANYRRFFLDK
jgi:hypothetical protein